MARADRTTRQDKGIDEKEMPEMTTMTESAARHMAAGVMDLDKLARLVEQDTGRTPGKGSLSSYCSRFRKHGANWVEAERERKRENPEKNRDASRRWRAENPENPEKAREAKRRWRAENPARKLLVACRARAKSRGHECTITADDVEGMLAPMTCSATGLPLTWEHRGDSASNPWAPSVDRLDCSKGYVPGNVRVVCWAFNMMRGDFPDEVVIKLAMALAARAP